jgi:hypothetical protein
MAKKKKNDGYDGPAKYVETWQDGYRKGTKEGMEWCIRTTLELEKKASTETAKAALSHIAKMMQRDLDRRQPPEPEK